MKNILYVIAGFAAAAACVIAAQKRTTPLKLQPVDELAHKLQDAWADHHTVA